MLACCCGGIPVDFTWHAGAGDHGGDHWAGLLSLDVQLRRMFGSGTVSSTAEN